MVKKRQVSEAVNCCSSRMISLGAYGHSILEAPLFRTITSCALSISLVCALTPVAAYAASTPEGSGEETSALVASESEDNSSKSSQDAAQAEGDSTAQEENDSSESFQNNDLSGESTATSKGNTSLTAEATEGASEDSSQTQDEASISTASLDDDPAAASEEEITDTEIASALFKSGQTASVSVATKSLWSVGSSDGVSYLEGAAPSSASADSELTIIAPDNAGYMLYEWTFTKYASWPKSAVSFVATGGETKSVESNSSLCTNGNWASVAQKVSAGEAVSLKWTSVIDGQTLRIRNVRFVPAELSVKAYTDFETPHGTARVVTKGTSTEVESSAPGSTVSFTASANPGYVFAGWKTSADASDYVATTNPYSVTLSDESLMLYADFQPAFDKGTGTKEDPYVISTAQDLIKLNQFVLAGNNFEGLFLVLANDISLADSDFNTIGSSINYFAGSFDGQGHAISNLTSTRGLFYALDATATVKDLTVSGNVTGACVGLIAGETKVSSTDEGTTIINCTVSGSVSNDTSSTCYLGGVVGQAYKGSVISSCASSVSFASTGSSGYVGGVVGSASNATISDNTYTGTIENIQLQSVGGIVGKIATCTVSGNTVEATISNNRSSYDYVGGIVGSADSGSNTISNNTFAGSVQATRAAGGIVGYTNAGWGSYVNTVEDNVASGTVKATTNAGGIVGENARSLKVLNNTAKQTSVEASSNAHRIIGSLDSYTTLASNQASSAMLVNGEVIDADDENYGAAKSHGSSLSLSATLADESFAYTGEDIKPEPVVQNNGETLTLGQDYTLTYPETSSAVGKYTVTVTFLNSLSGSTLSVDYEVVAASFEDATITVAEGSVYDGTEQKPAVIVQVNGKTLVEGTDYSLTYSNNVNVSNAASVLVTAQDNYTGSKNQTFTISAASFEATTVEGVEETYGYTGSEYTPEPVVKLGSTTLVKDIDYTVSYEGNRTDAGSFTTTITPKGNYAGDAKVIASTISESVLSAENVTLDATEFAFNGNKQTPSVTVKVGSTILVAGTDCEITYSEGCTNVGTYTVTITPKGNYSGEAIEKEFVINQASTLKLTSEDTTVSYDGLAHEAVFSATIDGKVAEGFTITYAESEEGEYGTEVPTLTSVGTKTVYAQVVDPQGNYAPATACATITITAADLGEAVVKLSDDTQTSYVYNAQAQMVEIESVTCQGAALEEGVDYEVALYQGDTLVDEAVQPAVYTVKLIGKGNYAGTLEVASFTITTPSMTDDASGITVEGAVLADATLNDEGEVAYKVVLAADAYDSESDAYQALEESYKTEEALYFAGYSVTLERYTLEGEFVDIVSTGFGANGLKITLPISEEYNGKVAQVVLVHQEEDGSMSTVEYADVALENGSFSITVDRLSEIAASVEEATDASEDGSSEGDDSEGDEANGADKANGTDEASDASSTTDESSATDSDSETSADSATSTTNGSDSSTSTTSSQSLAQTGDHIYRYLLLVAALMLCGGLVALHFARRESK
jgi:hypothetical protein